MFARRVIGLGSVHTRAPLFLPERRQCVGLKTYPRIWQLLQDAQEYPEWATTRLWEYIQPRRFHRRLVGRVVAAAGDLTRVDLVVEWVNSSTGTANILLFVEAKRASTVTSEFCYKVERQVFLAANAYIVATGAPHIWAMTCFGGSVRLWVFIWGRTYLVPFAPNTSKVSERGEYLDIATH